MLRFLFIFLVWLSVVATNAQSKQENVDAANNVSLNLTFLEPQNHTFVKPSVVAKLKVLILEDNSVSFEASDYQLCLELHSTNFDKIDAG